MAQKITLGDQESWWGVMDHEMLSVITRVGPEDLFFISELNLSLSAQSDQNFEWILVLRPHVTRDDLLEKVNLYWARKTQIHIVQADTDSRGGVLNIGLAVAHGEIFTVVDADDLLFDHFVKTFNEERKEKRNQCVILRTQVGRQYINDQKKNQNQISGESSISFLWPRKFNLSNHLSINQSPCHSLAFPAEQIKKFKINWDPSLNSVEDWDFLTNALQYLGVKDLDERTGIYRQEKKQSRSQQKTKKYLWQRSESTVRLRILLERSYKLTSEDIKDNIQRLPRAINFFTRIIPSDSSLYRLAKRIYLKFQENK
jgi:hypothetical protein